MLRIKTVLISLAMIAATNGYADIEQRIIGGSKASIDDWKSMAALVISPDLSSNNLYNRQFCGGNLISNKWVLSAAHCFFNADPATGLMTQMAPDEIRVVLGIDNLNSTSAEELVVTNIITHPDYDAGNAGSPNDIALLELAQTTNQPFMPLYTGPASEGTSSTVIGWGATEFDPFSEAAGGFPTQLQEVTVPVVSNETCGSTAAYKGIIVDSQICAGLEQGGKDSCSGDSGGPLMIEENGVFKQAGIVSFGAGCALADAYGVYTRVKSFTSWMADYTGDTDNVNNNENENNSDEEELPKAAASGSVLIMFLLLQGLISLSRRRVGE